MKIQAFSHYCVLSVSVKPPKNMISVVQVRGSVVALGGMHSWVLLSFTESLCLLLENDRLVPAFLSEGYFAGSLSKFFFFAFFSKKSCD